jgi:ribosomal protein L11 methyltransferase
VHAGGKIAALTLELPITRVAEADALLELIGAASITHGPAVDEDIVEPDPGTTPLWQRTRIRALFTDSDVVTRAALLLRDHFGAEIPIAVESVAESAWRDAGQALPARLEIGERLLITDATSRATDRQRTVVRLNRGLGFGTGQHPTTALCLEWLEAELEPGCTVIDYGCGSGVLAVAALRLGARRAYAVDIEPQAIEATVANAALNGLADRLWAGRPEDLATTRVDLVLANILAGPLVALAPSLAALTEPGGSIVLTGILVEQVASVQAIYAQSYVDLVATERDGWVRLVGRRAAR